MTRKITNNTKNTHEQAQTSHKPREIPTVCSEICNKQITAIRKPLANSSPLGRKQLASSRLSAGLLLLVGEVAGEDAAGAGHEFGAGAAAVVLGGAFAGSRGLNLPATQAQQLGADERIVLLLELGGELLHQGIVLGASLLVAGGAAAVFESGEHKHARHGPAGHAQATHAAPKRGRNLEQLVGVDFRKKVGKGRYHRLRAVVALHKVLLARIGTSLNINSLFHCLKSKLQQIATSK